MSSWLPVLFAALIISPPCRAQELVRMKGHTDFVLSAAFSPDGKTVISGSGDETLKLWDAATGKEIATFKGHKELIVTVAFSPDGKSVLSGGPDKSVRLWDVSSAEETASFKGHTSFISAVAFSPTGKTIISGSFDRTLRLWDIKTGRTLTVFKGHMGEVKAVAFSPDGGTILSGSQDGTVRLWDSRSGKQLGVMKGHTSLVTSVAFSPDGTLGLSGSGDSTVRFWDLTTFSQIAILHGHSNLVTSVAYSPDGKRVLSSGNDKVLILWDVETGRILATIHGHIDFIRTAAFSPDGTKAVSGGDDKLLKIWDLVEAEEYTRRKMAAAEFFDKGRALIRRLKFKEAKEFLEKASATDPENITYSNWLGSLYYDLSEYEKALAELDRTTKSNPAAAWNYYRAMSLIKTGIIDQRTRLALEWAQENVSEERKITNREFQIRDMLVRMNQYQAHLIQFDQLIKGQEYEKAEKRLQYAKEIFPTKEVERRFKELKERSKMALWKSMVSDSASWMLLFFLAICFITYLNLPSKKAD